MAMLAPFLQKIYENSKADALLIEKDFLRRYLTGFTSTDGYVVLGKEKCVLVVDLRYYEAAQKALQGSPVEVIEGTYPAALALLKDCKTLGVPFPFIDLARAEALKREGFVLTDCTAALESAMLIKTERELQCIARACDIAEEALLRLMGEIKEGMREREAAALLEYEMRSLGAEGTSFDTIMAFGAHGSVPHHETGETRLKFGDPVLIDFGCKVEGYCSDCTRTFLFGDDKKHEDFKSIYAHVLAAHELVKERLVEGMTGSQADEIARGYFKEHGLDRYFTHSLGHGIGLQIHEAPFLSPRGQAVLKNGMVFSDEPGLYIAGEIGVRIEDSVTLKDGKVCSFMRKTNRNLIIL